MGERESLIEAIRKLESQRDILGDAVVETAINSLREKLDKLEPAAGKGETGFPGTLKQVTCLFADLVDSTAISEGMDPGEFREMMNMYFSSTSAEVSKYGGTVGKFIGDAILATFGVPSADEHDPENAVRAGLGMVEAVKNLSSRTEKEKGIKLAIRVGINTGIVYASSGTQDYISVAGYVVNVASRLQAAAPHGGVLVSRDTYRHIKGVFNASEMAPVTVKGVSEPVPVYLVEGEKPRAQRFLSKGLDEVEAPMVGRDGEFARLKDIFDGVVESKKCRVVLVSGEAGVGKSRLLYEFINWVEDRPQPVRYFRARTDSPFGLAPYSLARDFLSFRFDIGNDDLQTAREKLENGIVSVMGPDGREKAHLIGHLAGFDFSGSPFLKGILEDGKQIRDRAFHYLTQLFSAMSSGVPAVAVFLEDIHWADDGSLELIRHLAQECASEPLLIVCNSRPELFEKKGGWIGSLAACDRIELAPLPDDDCQMLVHEILKKVPDTSEELVELIVKQAEGYPLYLEEFIKTLIEERVIVKGPEKWIVEEGKLSGLRMPPTLQGILQARLDSLPRRERETLQVAAIIGRVFWDKAVDKIEGGMRRPGSGTWAQVGKNLDILKSKEIIFERSASSFAGAREFTFKHALLHDVCYESVLKSVRQQYHALIAGWLRDASGEKSDLFSGLIAEHFEKANMLRDAGSWFERAGRIAKEAHLSSSAVKHYRRALSCLGAGEEAEDFPRKMEIFHELGEVLILQAKYGEAAAIFREMYSAAESARMTEARARAMNGLSWAQDRLGDYEGSLGSVLKAQACAESCGKAIELVRALFREGWALFRLGRTSEVLVTGEECLRRARELNARRETALSLKLLGIGHMLAGRYEKAAGYQEEALEVFRSLADKWGMANILNNLGENARQQGNYAVAEAIYSREMKILTEIGNKDGEIICLNNLGGTYVGLGRFSEAETLLNRAIELSQNQSSFVLPESVRFLGEAKLGQGRTGEAGLDALRALLIAEKESDNEVVGPVWRLLGMIAAGGDPVKLPEGKTLGSNECFAKSCEILSAIGAMGEKARTLRTWSGCERTAGNSGRAEELLAEARDIFRKLNLSLEVDRCG